MRLYLCARVWAACGDVICVYYFVRAATVRDVLKDPEGFHRYLTDDLGLSDAVATALLDARVSIVGVSHDVMRILCVTCLSLSMSGLVVVVVVRSVPAAVTLTVTLTLTTRVTFTA